MAEPKKKTATKTSSTSSKTTTKKKAPAKKSSTSKKSDVSVTKKTLVTAPVVKKAPAKKAPAISVQAKIVKETSDMPVKMPKLSAKKSLTDMSIFTTILAVAVVALVVLGGYIYSRQAYRMDTPTPTPATTVTEPQQIRISSSVILSPAIMSALEDLVKQIAIWPEEVLTKVTNVENVAAAQSVDPVFYADVREGDMVFTFKSTSVLFRPSSKEIINTGIVSE